MARRDRGAWAFLAPNAAGFLLFTLFPLLASLALSFAAWDGSAAAPRFVWFRNYAAMLSGGAFWSALGNTLVLMAGVPLGMAASLAFALLLDRELPERSIYRTMFFAPSVANLVAICFVWELLYRYPDGLLNRAFAAAGLHPIAWLRDPAWAKPALVLMGVWNTAGGIPMLVYLAALQGVPRDLLEQASIDGAGAFARFRHVTLPHLAPASFFLLTMGVIHGFQGGFQAAFLMTGGGPLDATTSLSYLIYRESYENYRFGPAAAASWLLFLLVFGATALNFRLRERKGAYA